MTERDKIIQCYRWIGLSLVTAREFLTPAERKMFEKWAGRFRKRHGIDKDEVFPVNDGGSIEPLWEQML